MTKTLGFPNVSEVIRCLNVAEREYCQPKSNRIFVVHYPTPDGGYREIIRFNSFYFGLKYFHYYLHDNPKALLQIIEYDGTNHFYFRRKIDGLLCLTKSPYKHEQNIKNHSNCLQFRRGDAAQTEMHF